MTNSWKQEQIRSRNRILRFQIRDPGSVQPDINYWSYRHTVTIQAGTSQKNTADSTNRMYGYRFAFLLMAWCLHLAMCWAVQFAPGISTIVFDSWRLPSTARSSSSHRIFVFAQWAPFSTTAKIVIYGPLSVSAGLLDWLLCSTIFRHHIGSWWKLQMVKVRKFPWHLLHKHG